MMIEFIDFRYGDTLGMVDAGVAAEIVCGEAGDGEVEGVFGTE